MNKIIYFGVLFILKLFLYEGPVAIVECGLISVLINKLSDNTDEIKVSGNYIHCLKQLNSHILILNYVWTKKVSKML